MDASTEPELSLDQLVELERRDAEAQASAAAADAAPLTADSQSGGSSNVVLPWWQHPVNIVTLVVTAAVLAGMIGWMVGDSAGRPQHNEVDTGFLQDMRIHHEQAVTMSFIYRNLPDTDPGLRTVARSIVLGQSLEVGRMVQLLRSFGEQEARDLSEPAMLWMGMSADPGVMPGMATEDELEQLGRSSGTEADELFVQLMTAHHLGGIEMAEFAAERGDSDEVRKMAESMAAAQSAEINEMLAQLG